jgi:shikimate 5-dehydrogenase
VKTPAYWGIAGFPINHSLTPRLFEIVGKYLGITDVNSIFIEAENIEEFTTKIDQIEGDIWLSCTTPLKHSIHYNFAQNNENDVGSINQLTRINGICNTSNTDGIGFISACKSIGISPNNSILKLRGGGSAARAIAASWAAEGGKIIAISGKRKLSKGPWDDAIVDSGEAIISVDLDYEKNRDFSIEMESKNEIHISYNEEYKIDDFAIIMLAAQHLEAWRNFYLPNRKNELPSLEKVLQELAK